MATPAGAVSKTTPTATCPSLSRCGSAPNAKPSWLVAALSELEEKYQAIAGSIPAEGPDSFAERAENYYRRRPELLALLHDLYHRYISLADRYSQTLPKPQPQAHRRSSSQASSALLSDVEDSDAESSLSFQCPPQRPPAAGAAELVAELVARAVENEVLQQEMAALEKFNGEAVRKMELQGSLVEVLESERMVLLAENARLGQRAVAAEEESEELAAEAVYLRRMAEELARCVAKLREDRRVCLLGRKIQELQAQIYALEKRNRECYEVMTRRDSEKADIVRGVCVELERVKAENRRLREAAAAGRRRHKGRRRWWARFGLRCGS
ncbi:kinase interacting (KIP1-like) family protein [Wolffia australiana]